MVNDCPPPNTNDYTVEWWEFTRSSVIFTRSGADRGRAREIFNVLWVTATEAAEHVESGRKEKSNSKKSSLQRSGERLNILLHMPGSSHL
ncbi:hypothetical protein PDJAM_G00110090 [Pangasius djambal]|uniref:Uncharacterized protein n=1 Tax=Pangasius djambal TaxID=1691987 RepID=A0ACC5Y2B1_9TELE|nr:hypothetical protein [Pangasius djambal]